MMIDIIKKFVKYGIFESTTDNYDYAIVDNKHDFFDKYYLTNNTITYNGMKLNCYSGSRFFFDGGKIIHKSEITCYGVNADYYIEAMEKLEIQRKIKAERAEKLSIAKAVLKELDGKMYNKKINEALVKHHIYMDLGAYSIQIYYTSDYGSCNEYLFSSCDTSLLHSIFKVPKGGKREKFYYSEKLQDALFNAYNNTNSEVYEIAKILEAPENYFKSCAKLNKLHEEYTQQISTLRNNISTYKSNIYCYPQTIIKYLFKKF